MATAPWPGFAAAAPRLIKMTLLAVSALLSRSSVPTAAAELVELTLLANAREKGAVCLDGSPPAYQLRTGFGSGSRSWLVNLEGGAWCNTTEDCSSRRLTDLGSSKFMKPIEFEGMLSNNHTENPYFYNWNIVDVRYCDGGSFAGDAEGEDRNGTKLFYRGLRIWEAVVDELMAKGMDTAKQALLAGCSAGGLASLLHCDNFRARFPSEVPVKCLSDADSFLMCMALGILLECLDFSGERFMRSIFSGVVHLQNVRGAVCLDGSPPGYHLRRGFGSGAHNWLVFLEGGGWCNITQSCSERKMTSFGSSKYMGAVNFNGILSNDHIQNPDFYNWNIAVIRYCDGGSFAGDAEGQDLDGTKLFFRGLRIWESVVDELMGKGMDGAKQALLTGCSAGSLAALLHCDNFRGRFPHEVSVKCLSDAGFFIDEKDLSGERSMRLLISGVVHLQNVREVLPNNCLQKKDPTECFFPAELIKDIITPTFILNSDYDSWQIRNILAPNGSYPGQAWSSCKADIRNCSCTQIDVLHGFKKKLVSELKVAEDNKDWGLFIDSCFTHCQTPFNITWHSPISPRLGDKSIAEAVGDWYFGRRQDVKLIDCEYPCNPTCSSLLPTS